jgi:hypothetical protein
MRAIFSQIIPKNKKPRYLSSGAGRIRLSFRSDGRTQPGAYYQDYDYQDYDSGRMHCKVSRHFRIAKYFLSNPTAPMKLRRLKPIRPVVLG